MILISCHIDTTSGHLAIKIGCPPVTLQIFHFMPNIDLPPRAKSHITCNNVYERAKYCFRICTSARTTWLLIAVCMV